MLLSECNQYLAILSKTSSAAKWGTLLIFSLAHLGNYLTKLGCLPENQLVHGQELNLKQNTNTTNVIVPVPCTDWVVK